MTCPLNLAPGTSARTRACATATRSSSHSRASRSSSSPRGVPEVTVARLIAGDPEQARLAAAEGAQGDRRGDAEDQLGGIAERRVEQASRRGTHPLGQPLGGVAHRLRQRDQRSAGDEEDHRLVLDELVEDPCQGQKQPAGTPEPFRDHARRVHASKRIRPWSSLRTTRCRASSTSRFPITSESVR